MDEKIASRNEYDNELTELKSLLCKIPKFGSIVRRFPFGDDRKYFITEPDVVIFHGLTAYIGMLPTDKWEEEPLIQYRVKHGNRFLEELNHAADYGTFCHESCAQFVTTGVLDLNELKDEFRSYCMNTGMPMARWKTYSYRLVNDMKAFAAFCHKSNMEALATEYVVYDREKLIATPLDLVCRIKFNKKMVTANINFKFRESPALYNKDVKQTGIETMIYNSKHRDTFNEITNSFTWSPSDWKTDPNWKLFNTTGKYGPHLWSKDHKILQLRGVLEIDKNIKFTSKAGGVISFGQPVVQEEETLENFCLKYKNTQ